MNSEGVLAKSVGSGVEGDVKGLLDKWTYDMDFSAGRFNKIEGFIIED